MSPEEKAELDERLGALYHAMSNEVQRTEARLSVIERALEAVLGDVDAILMAVSEEPDVENPGEWPQPEDDGGPDDLRMGYGSDDEQFADMHAAIDAAEAANETPAAERDGDPNSIVEVPEEGITVIPGRPEPRMRRHRSA